MITAPLLALGSCPPSAVVLLPSPSLASFGNDPLLTGCSVSLDIDVTAL